MAFWNQSDKPPNENPYFAEIMPNNKSKDESKDQVGSTFEQTTHHFEICVVFVPS